MRPCSPRSSGRGRSEAEPAIRQLRPASRGGCARTWSCDSCRRKQGELSSLRLLPDFVVVQRRVHGRGGESKDSSAYHGCCCRLLGGWATVVRVSSCAMTELEAGCGLARGDDDVIPLFPPKTAPLGATAAASSCVHVSTLRDAAPTARGVTGQRLCAPRVIMLIARVRWQGDGDAHARDRAGDRDRAGRACATQRGNED